MSVLLSDADASRLREAMLWIYSMLAEADTRARAGQSGYDVRPYHVATQLRHIDETPLPAAEFFVTESGIMARDRAQLAARVRMA